MVRIQLVREVKSDFLPETWQKEFSCSIFVVQAEKSVPSRVLWYRLKKKTHPQNLIKI